MNAERKTRRLKCRLALILIAACTISVLAYNARNGDDKLITQAQALAAANVTARQAVIGGRSVGEVLVNNEVVLRIRSSAGGLTPYQRAQRVAQRLEALDDTSIRPEDITTGIVNGQEVVLAGGELLVTADTTHARLNQIAPNLLADQWASNLRVAYGGESVAATAGAATPTGQKIVPIISAGSGVRVGGAQVTGPRNRVDDVVAVAQIEGSFGNSVRARVLVPVSAQNVVQNISRVPQTSVTALVDIRL